MKDNEIKNQIEMLYIAIHDSENRVNENIHFQVNTTLDKISALKVSQSYLMDKDQVQEQIFLAFCLAGLAIIGSIAAYYFIQHLSLTWIN
jgi:hypothetical protein